MHRTPQSTSTDATSEGPKNQSSSSNQRMQDFRAGVGNQNAGRLLRSSTGSGGSDEHSASSNPDVLALGNPLADKGSHHRPYPIEGDDTQIFLETGDPAKSLADRQKSYESFKGATFVPAPGQMRLAKGRLADGSVLNGLVLPRVQGQEFHGAGMAWSGPFGVKKFIDEWLRSDPTGAARKIDRLIAGIGEFFGHGRIVEDFQFWIRNDGQFFLTDVKSANIVRGQKPEDEHRELTVILTKLEALRRKLPAEEDPPEKEKEREREKEKD